MKRHYSNQSETNRWMHRLAELVVLSALLSWPALAGTNYILEVKGSSLEPVLGAYGLTLQRELFSSSLLTVGVVSIPDEAQSSSASLIEQDERVLKFQLDRPLVAKAPKLPVADRGVTNLQAWLLSMQSVQQKTNSYLNQAALSLVGSATGNMGAGITVAVIDTAIDTNHSVLAGKLQAGVDCVGSANCTGGITSISNDPSLNLDQSTVIILDQSTVIILDQSTVIILDQSTVIILDGKAADALQGQQLPADFGHGTMVASLISAAAPNAMIMPIRAFNADGSSQLSDVVAAVMYAADHGAQVINMSFDLDTSDPALSGAIAYATSRGAICVASTGNEGSNSSVYPAAYNSPSQPVIGVGSVDSMTGLFRSSFSGFGSPSVDVYAPGENLIAAYPGNHFAIASGTSFATALASGVAAVVKSNTSGVLSDYVNAITSTGSPVLFPYDGMHMVNAKAADKSLKSDE